MEKKDVVMCPSCEVENPKSRATCQICHEPLYIKTEKVEKRGTKKFEKVEENMKAEAKISSPPLSSPIAKVLPPNPFTNQPKPKDKSSIPSKEEISKPPIKRRAKRKSHIIPESQYFILQGQILLPVEITQHVRVLKKKAVKAEARMVIDLWNHNKSLLAK